MSPWRLHVINIKIKFLHDICFKYRKAFKLCFFFFFFFLLQENNALVP